MLPFILVGIGGFLGSLGRYSLGLLLSRFVLSQIPFPTMIINLLGSFCIGIILSLNESRPSQYWYFLVPGILGGFTTFSAFSAETMMLLREQLYVPAAIYVVLTLLGGLALCASGYFLMKTIINT